jgi:hypothetical protein
MLKIRWLVPGRVIFSCAADDVTLDELRYQIENFDQMSRRSDTVVHVIHDSRGVTSFPNEIDMYRRVLFKHDNLGHIAVVDPHPRSRMMTRLLVGLIQNKTPHFFDTIDAAKAFLQAQDDSLPPLPDVDTAACSSATTD